MEEGGDGKIGSLKMTGIGGAVRKSERNSLASSFDRFAARDGRTARWQGWAGYGGYHGNERERRHQRLGNCSKSNLRIEVSEPLWHSPPSPLSMKFCRDY